METFGTATKTNSSSQTQQLTTMKTGIEHISKERQRQLSQEGWTAENDDSYEHDELINAAACYMSAACTYDGGLENVVWPWHPFWWKPGEPGQPVDKVRCLTKAGALIAAEIDRLQRLNAETCSVCGGSTMVPGEGPDADVMNTPCPACNEWSQKRSPQRGLLTRLRCWWFGCCPVWDRSAIDYNGDCIVPCSRCGAEDLPYGQLFGDSRAKRFRQWFVWLLLRWWLPAPCRDCGKRYGHHHDCVPF